MKFVADESVDYQIVSRLREDGHEVLYIAETQSGASDDSVLTQANLQQAVLLTSDKDFGDLVFRQNLVSSGIVAPPHRRVIPRKKGSDCSQGHP